MGWDYSKGVSDSNLNMGKGGDDVKKKFVEPNAVEHDDMKNSNNELKQYRGSGGKKDYGSDDVTKGVGKF